MHTLALSLCATTPPLLLGSKISQPTDRSSNHTLPRFPTGERGLSWNALCQIALKEMINVRSITFQFLEASSEGPLQRDQYIK